MARRASRGTPGTSGPDFTFDGGTEQPSDANSGVPSETSAASGAVINPGDIGAGDDGQRDGGSDRPGRKPRSDRGKPRGPRGAKETAIDLGSFAEILSEVHSGLAFVLSVPEIALDETKEEHLKLARAIQRVSRHYDIPALDPVVQDWLMLFKCLLLIYGSRIMAYNFRTRAERAKPAPAGTRHDLGPAPAAAPPAPKPVVPGMPQPKPPSHITVAVPGFEDIPVSVKLN